MIVEWTIRCPRCGSSYFGTRPSSVPGVTADVGECHGGTETRRCGYTWDRATEDWKSLVVVVRPQTQAEYDALNANTGRLRQWLATTVSVWKEAPDREAALAATGLPLAGDTDGVPREKLRKE